MSIIRPPADVRFGSKADICSASTHVRFTPRADMCGATGDVCYGLKTRINGIGNIEKACPKCRCYHLIFVYWFFVSGLPAKPSTHERKWTWRFRHRRPL